MPTPDFILELRKKIGNDPLWLSGVCAVVLRPLDEPREVLLVKRADNGHWTPIKGIMDPGETVPETVLREAFEETGVRIRVDRLVAVGVLGPVSYANGDVTTYLDHTVRAEWVSGAPLVGDDESSAVGWFRLDALPEPMAAGDLARIEVAVANPADPVLEGLPR